MSDEDIPYTHWAYFEDEATARRCGGELERVLGCRWTVEPDNDGLYLLRAGRVVSILHDWHTAPAAIVRRHGGYYDGGETGPVPLRATSMTATDALSSGPDPTVAP